MPWTSARTGLLWTAVAGVALGVVYTASPITLVALGLFVLTVRLTTRGLPTSEARTIAAVLVLALALRLLLVASLFIAGIPWHNDLSVGALSGDEAYNISRAMRARDILLGLATTKYDFFVTYDEYGRTSYLSLLTVLQVLFGPTPYSVRVLNAVAFIIGAAVIFRITRRSFGPLPATAGLIVLLFLPSLAYASASVLKESLYFLATAIVLACAIHVVRSKRVLSIAGALLLGTASLMALDGLRRGGTALALAGLAVGLAARFGLASVRRAIVFAALLLIATTAAIIEPRLNQRLIAGLESAAKMHAGHVFTVGHAYKLLDEGFYVNPVTPASSLLTLTPVQAGRFVLRGVFSFVTTPFPWNIASRRELAFLPEHLVWYLILLGLPAGIVVGWRLDPLVTAMLIGYVVPTAAVLALTNGNVGTLVRLRGLVTPYLVWIGALGYCVMLEALSRRRKDLRPTFSSTTDLGAPGYAAPR